MSDDDLNAHLGQFPVQKAPSRLAAHYSALAFGAVGLLVVLAAFLPVMTRPSPLVSYAAKGTAPSGTIPYESPAGNASTNVLPPQTLAKAVSGTAVSPQDVTSAVPEERARSEVEAIERRAGVKVVRAGGGAPPGALVIDVTKALNAGVPAAPDPRLIEQSRYGPVPRIGGDGARPSEVYARHSLPSDGATHAPRIALFVGGMGLAPRATETAIANLPGAVTLGFAPYGADLVRQTARAREAGHEVVLQIPMEPFDFPRDNPGPRTLTTGAGRSANFDNLTWLLSRFTGYAGVSNFLGGKFTADEKALAPVLREVAARGLFYLDDGTSSQSLAMTLAPGQGLMASRADIVLDSTTQPEAIEAALTRLESIARDKGVAIGVVSALPASIEGISRFAHALEGRGIALIPVSAAMQIQHQGSADSVSVR